MASLRMTGAHRKPRHLDGPPMLDLLLLALGLGIFTLLAAYAAACERI
jgi:hypothetical protein